MTAVSPRDRLRDRAAQNGALPLLAPMSEVAGRMATQIGAHFLERQHGGRGVLLGGAPGVRPGRWSVVLGAGNVGWNSGVDRGGDGGRGRCSSTKTSIACGLSTRSTTAASSRWRRTRRGGRTVAEADLVIGAILVAGGRAPVVVTEAMVRSMRPGSVIVDVAVDQGGCIETTRETTHNDPVYEQYGVIHYAVGNMPGAVPFTSTYALTNATLPYVLEVALGPREAALADPALAAGFNTVDGHVTNEAVATALSAEYVPLDHALP